MIRTAAKCATAAVLLTGALSLTACVEEVPLAEIRANLQAEIEANTPPVAEEPPQGDDDMQLLDGTMFEPLRNNSATMLQLTPLTPGEELAVIHTNMGDITVRFFPEEAPMAVENFTTHARNGYYDGVIFHRVIPGFMIQGGCPYGMGTGGEDIWGGRFHTEGSFNLRHFNGALAMAHAGPGTIGSQFYIVQNYDLDNSHISRFEHMIQNQDNEVGRFADGTILRYSDVNPTAALEHYIAHGGTPHLDWVENPHDGHPVFGHVVDGMDVVNTIANTAAEASRPLEDMIIESISFIVYGA